jgi:FdhE protein
LKTAADISLNDLKNRRPEWMPWLSVVEEILREVADSRWDALVPGRTGIHQNKIPLLTETRLDVAKSPVPALLTHLIRVASRSGTPQMATLGPLAQAKFDLCALFRASLHQDHDYIKELAIAHGAEPEALQAVLAMAPMPFLHACNRHWATSGAATGWMEGYCPTCGAWPALTEVRGIERSRHFRCGRCGAEWPAPCLLCPFCGMTDHKELLSLVPENSRSNTVIDACKRCRGYVKTFTRLQANPPAKILLDDLDSVELDVAAVEQGYKRPQGNGYSLNVTVFDSGTLRGHSAQS